MVDIWDASKRSIVMSRIRSKNTKPELSLRSSLHKAGARFRLHVSTLPGKPDIVFPGCKVVVFVQGCFWHQHKGCRDGVLPKSNIDFWKLKLERNVCNDKKRVRLLRKLGWTSISVWECEIEQDLRRATDKVLAFVRTER